MNLNTDIRQITKQDKKIVYPTKRSMNLYYKEDRTTAASTVGLYVLFAAVVLFALFKFAIYDPISQRNQLEQRVQDLERVTAAQMVQLKDYDKVLEEYIRATPTQEEQTKVACMEILQLVDGVIRPSAGVSQISIADNKVLMTFSDITLEEAALLVSQLEQSPLVTTTNVDTAVSIRENQKLVEVHVYFEVAKEEEAQQ